MNEPLVVPGEVDLESPAPEPVVEPVAAPEPEPVAVEAQPEPEPEPVVEEPPAPERPKKPGLVAELVEERKERKRLADELSSLRQEMRTRLAPQGPSPAEVERERADLEAMAQELRLVRTDENGQQFWDLDAAKRVRNVVTREARVAAAEAVRPVQRQSMEERAGANITAAVAHAKTLGLNQETIDIIHSQYLEVAKQANGAELLARPDVAETVWRQALGSAVVSGAFKPTAAAAVAAPKPTPAIPAPAAGRRAPQASVQLSPSLQRVYRDGGLDPAKHTTYTPDKNGAISLED